MKQTSLIVLCVLLALFFSGCVVVYPTGTSTVSGKGAMEKYEIKVGEYNRIKVAGNCEIQYYAAPSNTVTLEIQPNLREYFVVEVQDGELIVRTERISHNSRNPPVLTVSTPVLNSLTIAGICTFKGNDTIRGDTFNLELSGTGSGSAELEVNRLNARMSGVGSFVLYGRADNAEINLSGTGELNASSLQVREASVDLSGVGTIRVYCSEKLHINAGGTGTVEYRGSPSLSLNTSGLVSIRQAN